MPQRGAGGDPLTRLLKERPSACGTEERRHRAVGYGRFVGVEATAALDRLYAAVRLYGNLFQPSFKLQEKTRIGARVIKR